MGSNTPRSADIHASLNEFAIDNAVVGVSCTRPDGSHMYVNDTLCRLLGYSRPELLNLTIPGCTPDFTREMWRAHWAEVKHRGSLTFETRLRRKNGEFVQVEITDHYASFGDQEYNCTFIRDISTRRVAEQELRESEERLRLAAEAGNVGLWDWDLVSNRARYSTQWKRQIGYAEHEIADDVDEWQSRVHPDDLPAVLKQVEAYLADPAAPYLAEFRLRHKDGTYRWIRTQAALVRDAQGKPARMLGSHVDITDRKQAEEQLRLYAALIDASTEFIGIADLTGNVTYLNPAGCRLAGIDPAEVRTKKITDFALPDDLARVEQEILPAIFSHGSWQGEFCLRHFQTGAPVPIALYAFLINDPKTGKPTVLANISHDISERKQVEQALRDSEQRLARLIGNLPGAVYRCKNDADWTTEYISNGVQALTGYAPDDFIEGRIKGPSIIHPDDRSAVADETQRAVVAHRPFELLYRITTRDGALRWIWERGQGVYRDDGELIALEGFLTDISARIQAEQAVRNSEQRLRTIIETEPECVMLVGTGGILAQINTAGLAMIEADTAEQVTGRCIYPLVMTAHREAFRALVERALAGEKDSLQFEITTLRGARRWLETYATPIDDSTDGKRYALGIARDITDQKHTAERLSYLAHHDVLTGLPNRALFNDRLSQAMIEAHRHGRLIGVLLLDLDRFKTINDTLGHQAGDLLLKHVSARLRRCVREGDTVARLSGDEFAMVLADMGHLDDGARVAQKVLAAFAEVFPIANREFHVTPSIGITLYPVDGDSIEQLLRNADAAMYRAKDAGRNNYQFYTTDMTRQAFERLSLENTLRRALERDEFHLEYQPIVDCRTGRIVTLEALIRWRDPERGVFLPGQFIAVAEDTGLIVPMGEWVLHTACAQLARWQASGTRDIRAAINLSVRQFRQRDLAQTLTHAVESAAIAPASLELEITESILAEGNDIAAAMREIHEMGIQFSIDDFGVGYSSLSYLKRFPIDSLKIDQSFVRDIPGDAEDTAIATAIIAMAHGLGIKVVAEGVETEAQLTFLRSQDCDLLQGFYLSRPLAANDVARLLQQPHPFGR